MTNKRAELFWLYMEHGARRLEFRYILLIINREILPEDARICFTSYNDNEEFQWNSKNYSIYNDLLRNCAFCCCF